MVTPREITNGAGKEGIFSKTIYEIKKWFECYAMFNGYEKTGMNKASFQMRSKLLTQDDFLNHHRSHNVRACLQVVAIYHAAHNGFKVLHMIGASSLIETAGVLTDHLIVIHQREHDQNAEKMKSTEIANGNWVIYLYGGFETWMTMLSSDPVIR